MSPLPCSPVRYPQPRSPHLVAEGPALIPQKPVKPVQGFFVFRRAWHVVVEMVREGSHC